MNCSAVSNSASYIFLNDELISHKNARIPTVSSGLYYGAGCFETFISEKGNIFRYEDHIRRLNRGLKYLGIKDKNLPDLQSILDNVKSLLEANDLLKRNARIRIQASLIGESGYSSSEESLFFFLITSDLIDTEQRPQSLILSETCVVPSTARPTDLKLSNMLHYRHTFREAEKQGADDGIMLNVRGYVAETSIANLFWKKGEKVYTPSEECDILPGIMRDSIIKILRDEMNLEVKEGKYSLDDLMNSDVVWLTNSILNFCSVKRVEDVSFEADNSFYSSLNNYLSAFKEEKMTHV